MRVSDSSRGPAPGEYGPVGPVAINDQITGLQVEYGPGGLGIRYNGQLLVLRPENALRLAELIIFLCYPHRVLGGGLRDGDRH
jgi:hypothetical protein